jgi:hypothetical protein
MTDLPPLDLPNAYVVLGPDDQRGPYTLELLISEVAAGHLDDNTPVWWPGTAGWTTFAADPVVYAEVRRRREQVGMVAGFQPAAQPVPLSGDSGVAPIEVEPTPSDFEAVDRPVEGYDMTAAMGLDPVHGQTFADLIERSRARAEAAALVEQIDERFVEALTAAASEVGLQPTRRTDDEGVHSLVFSRGPGRELTAEISTVNGHVVANNGNVDLRMTERAQNHSATATSGEAAGKGDHGTIVLTVGPDSVASAEVTLVLALSDYVSSDHIVDSARLQRDFAAVMVHLGRALG